MSAGTAADALPGSLRDNLERMFATFDAGTMTSESFHAYRRRIIRQLGRAEALIGHVVMNAETADDITFVMGADELRPAVDVDLAPHHPSSGPANDRNTAFQKGMP